MLTLVLKRGPSSAMAYGLLRSGLLMALMSAARFQSDDGAYRVLGTSCASSVFAMSWITVVGHGPCTVFGFNDYFVRRTTPCLESCQVCLFLR